MSKLLDRIRIILTRIRNTVASDTYSQQLLVPVNLLNSEIVLYSTVKNLLPALWMKTHAPNRPCSSTPGDLSCYQNRTEFPEEKCCLIVESGFSFTHIVPYVLGQYFVTQKCSIL